MDANRVEVDPFGPKRQNVAPRLRIIFQALLGPQTQFKNSKTKTNMLTIPLFTVQSHQLYIETPDKPLWRLLVIFSVLHKSNPIRFHCIWSPSIYSYLRESLIPEAWESTRILQGTDAFLFITRSTESLSPHKCGGVCVYVFLRNLATNCPWRLSRDGARQKALLSEDTSVTFLSSSAAALFLCFTSCSFVALPGPGPARSPGFL